MRRPYSKLEQDKIDQANALIGHRVLIKNSGREGIVRTLDFYSLNGPVLSVYVLDTRLIVPYWLDQLTDCGLEPS